MDTNQLLDNELNVTDTLYITPTIRRHLSDTAWWAKFLSIVGFVVVGLMVVLAFSVVYLMNMVSGSEESGIVGMSSAGLTSMYLAIAGFYFFPVFFLYKFATKMQTAIRENDTHELTISFSNLNKLYKFLGVLTIIILAIYGLVLLLAMIGGFAALF